MPAVVPRVNRRQGPLPLRLPIEDAQSY